MAEKFDPLMILDYYKDWSSDKAPIMMILDSQGDFSGYIESEDQRKMAYLRKKYGKRAK